MAQWILKANGNAVLHRSSRPLKVDEIHAPLEIKKRAVFDGLIERRWGASINPPKQTDAEGLMDFTRKARWVLDGHKTPNPIGSTYAGVVSRDSIRIAFTYAALNGLDVFAADIRNAYLQAPSSQKDYILCGPEFGIENVGKIALIL